ncbi:DUF6111 family protein [Minwuia thermotolerans]|jgi:phosphoglycerol transferase MdoB-like AlkP superfamily enzyme|uniref:Uncharacterized protein n=1 Tax=Minwuia thermotolerans TaxID=2056226 RepID=A0A2M9G6P1_9PROT|nr:DUF6111 family protein [Minwuia thermotolerans]ANK81066.1 MAG: hypothetical protein TEF_09855 [Rhizobiales bacterium NRL2]PJK31389.1 hypothetical protein CVT23_01540 [Minwuia thermotolerans]
MRRFIIHVVPFLLPFVLYGIYWLIAKRRENKGLTMVPWLWLTASGLALSVITMAVLAFMMGSEPGGEYIPPRYEDGVIKPAETRPAE